LLREGLPSGLMVQLINHRAEDSTCLQQQMAISSKYRHAPLHALTAVEPTAEVVTPVAQGVHSDTEEANVRYCPLGHGVAWLGPVL
jgi:hypothetical protein